MTPSDGEKKTQETLIVSKSETISSTQKRYPNYKLLPAIISALIVGPALIFLAYQINPSPNAYPTTFIICISGYILGWILAIIATPMDKQDEDKISRFTKIAGTFLSGYLLGKIDKIILKITDPAFLSTFNGVRVLLFLCCCGFTFIMVFYYREYKYN